MDKGGKGALCSSAAVHSFNLPPPLQLPSARLASIQGMSIVPPPPTRRGVAVVGVGDKRCSRLKGKMSQSVFFLCPSVCTLHLLKYAASR